jgi:hypothetical protein
MFSLVSVAIAGDEVASCEQQDLGLTLNWFQDE